MYFANNTDVAEYTEQNQAPVNHSQTAEAAIEVAVQAYAETKRISESRTAIKWAQRIGAVTIFAKKVPFLGAFVTAGFAAKEVAGHAVDGNYKLAAASFAAGAAETAGAMIGFSVGDAFREIARRGLIELNPNYEDVQKSDIRILVEAGASALDFNTNGTADTEKQHTSSVKQFNGVSMPLENSNLSVGFNNASSSFGLIMGRYEPSRMDHSMCLLPEESNLPDDSFDWRKYPSAADQYENKDNAPPESIKTEFSESSQPDKEHGEPSETYNLQYPSI